MPEQTPPASSVGTPSTGGSGNKNQLAPGTILSGNRYRIEGLIAAGGMGAVYRAVDTRFNRPCAVKEMLDNFHNESERVQALEWFAREATLLLDLNHPCIPRVRDFFDENSKNYLVMDLINGRTLGDVLAREGNVEGINGARGVTEEKARSWARQVSSVLAYLHRQEPPIIFRDLKPSNIMVTDRDEIKLIDFGIARPFQTQAQSTVIMTLGYAPPEQLHGMPEPRSDLYALGATIHRLLTRHDATNNKPNIFSFPPLRSLRPDVSVQFEQIIARALAPNLDQRWQSAELMERAITNLPPVTVAPPMGGQAGFSGIHNAPSGPRSTQNPSSLSGLHSGQTASTTGPAGVAILDGLAHLKAVPPRIEQAYGAANHAFSLEPNNPLVHKIYGQVFARRNPAQADFAIRAYERSLQLNVNDAETHKLLADAWFLLRQNPQQAIPEYIQALRLQSNDFEAHDRLAQCYEKTNQFEGAVREFQEAVKLAPVQPALTRLRIYFALGLSAMRINQFAAAEHAFVQVLVLNPGDHQARFLLSQVYEKEGKLQEALTQCEYVIQPLGNRPDVNQLYLSLKQRLGR